MTAIQKILLSLPLRLPPGSEQQRIVDTLDELLPGLDDAAEELTAAARTLTTYRRSLLKSAVEGALTAEWRRHNPPHESGAELLARILRERRARWGATGQSKYIAPAALRALVAPTIVRTDSTHS